MAISAIDPECGRIRGRTVAKVVQKCAPNEKTLEAEEKRYGLSPCRFSFGLLSEIGLKIRNRVTEGARRRKTKRVMAADLPKIQTKPFTENSPKNSQKAGYFYI